MPAINAIAEKYQLPVIFSTHPRTRKKLEEQIGHSVISKEKASDYLPPADRWESLPTDDIDDKE